LSFAIKVNFVQACGIFRTRYTQSKQISQDIDPILNAMSTYLTPELFNSNLNES